MNADAAARLADRAMTFIAADPELVGALLAASGAAPGDLRRMAADPGFAPFILDFLLESDARVLAFAGHEGIAPGQVLTARQVLGGPADWH